MKFFSTLILTTAVLAGAVHSASITSTIPTTTIHPHPPALTTSTASPAWTTRAPVSDDKLTHLSTAVTALYNATAAIHADFELHGQVGDEAGLHGLTVAIKKRQTEALLLGVQIKQELLANTLNPDLLFSRRLSLELLEQGAVAAGRVLTEMAEIALGLLGGLAKWPAYELSESLGSAMNVMNARMVPAILAMAETDIALRGQLRDLKVVDAKTRAKVDASLATLASTADTLRVEANKELAEEEARLRLEGKAVNLWQRFQFEGVIDGLTYIVTYTKHFKELFDRVNGGH